MRNLERPESIQLQSALHACAIVRCLCRLRASPALPGRLHRDRLRHARKAGGQHPLLSSQSSLGANRHSYIAEQDAVESGDVRAQRGGTRAGAAAHQLVVGDNPPALPPTGTSGRPATRTDLAVSAAGFEPTTPGSGGRCSIQMSYAPKLRTIHSPRLARAQGPRCGARGGSSRWRIRRTASSACECYALTGRTHPRRSQGQGKLRRSGRIRREQTIWFRRNRLQSRSARRILRRATSPEQWGSTDWDCSGC